MNGGLRFPDAACQARFGVAGFVPPEAFDAFAHCLAGLHLRPTGRADAFDDTSVLTDDAGFELEARVVDRRLDFIGFSNRGPGLPDRPSITPAALEALRASGDPHATINADEASRILHPSNPNGAHTEHLRLCLSERGELASVGPATTTSPGKAKAFAAVTRDWRFRPFLVEDKPLAVCATVALHYPAAPRDETQDRLPRPPSVSKAGHIVYNASPSELETLRISGSKLLVPDDEDKVRLNGKRITGSFKLCLDETGHYESGLLLRSTGVPRYDAKIARTMMTEWVYRPYLFDGVAMPVCTAITFIYSQR